MKRKLLVTFLLVFGLLASFAVGQTVVSSDTASTTIDSYDVSDDSTEIAGFEFTGDLDNSTNAPVLQFAVRQNVSAVFADSNVVVVSYDDAGNEKAKDTLTINSGDASIDLSSGSNITFDGTDTVEVKPFFVYPTTSKNITSVDGDSVSVTLDDDNSTGNIVGVLDVQPGEAAQLSMNDFTGSYYAGEDFTPNPNVTIQDQHGNTKADESISVSLLPVLNSDNSKGGNGDLNVDDVTTPSSGEREFSGVYYTKDEDINVVASAEGLSSDTSGAITMSPGPVANVSVSYGKESLTVNETVDFDVTVTDEYFNEITGDAFTVSEVKGGGGSFTGVDPAPTTVTYTPSKYYVGEVKIKTTTSGDVASHTKTLDVNAGPLGNVNLTAADGSTDTVGTSNLVTAELVDNFGNHKDASSVDDVSFTSESDDNASLGTPSLNDNGIIEATYTMGEHVDNTDTLTVETVQGSYTDDIIFTKTSGPPAKMALENTTADGDSILISGKDENEAFVDTVWDAYGNMSDGYDIAVSSSDDIKINAGSNEYDIDTLTTDGNGLVNFDVTPDSAAGTQTIEAWGVQGDASASVDIEVIPSSPAMVDMSWDTTRINGQEITLIPEITDSNYNPIMAGDSLMDYKATFAKEDTGSGKVGMGTLGDTDTTDNNNFSVNYTTYEKEADSSRIVVAAYGTAEDDTVATDTAIVKSIPSGTLDQLVIDVTNENNETRVTSPINIEITPKDVNGAIKYGYEKSLNVQLKNSDADEVLWKYPAIPTYNFEETDTVPDWGMENWGGIGDPSLDISSGEVYTGDQSIKLSGDFSSGSEYVINQYKALDSDVNYITYRVWLPQEIIDAAEAEESGGVSPYLQHTSNWTWEDSWTDITDLEQGWNKIIFEIPDGVDNSTVETFGLQIKMLDADAPDADAIYVDDIVLSQNPGNVKNVTFQSAPTKATEGKFELSLQNFIPEEGVTVEVGAADSDVSAETEALTFKPGEVDSLALSAPDTVQGEKEFDFTVTPLDMYGNVNDIDEVEFKVRAEYPDMIEIDGGALRAITGPKTYTTKNYNVATDSTKQQSIEVYETPGDIKMGSVSFVVERTTGIEDGDAPEEFALEDNYPNPFNPTTNIKMHIKEQSDVKLTVYNMLGQKVKEMSRSFDSPGIYNVKLNATDLSSGTYIYRMKANNEIINTKKMTLVK